MNTHAMLPTPPAFSTVPLCRTPPWVSQACRALALLALLATTPLALAQNETDGDAKLPSGKLKMTEDGSVLTLDNGEKFISKTGTDPAGNSGDILIFPNGQFFTTETAKSGGHGIWVSTDGTLVGVSRHPATKMGMVYLYVKQADGKFADVPDVNDQVSKLLKKAGEEGWSNAAVDNLSLREMNGHTLTLASVYYDGKYHEHKFQVTVAPDGALSLAKTKTKKKAK